MQCNEFNYLSQFYDRFDVSQAIKVQYDVSEVPESEVDAEKYPILSELIKTDYNKIQNLSQLSFVGKLFKSEPSSTPDLPFTSRIVEALIVGDCQGRVMRYDLFQLALFKPENFTQVQTIQKYPVFSRKLYIAPTFIFQTSSREDQVYKITKLIPYQAQNFKQKQTIFGYYK